MEIPFEWIIGLEHSAKGFRILRVGEIVFESSTLWIEGPNQNGGEADPYPLLFMNKLACEES
jgi:hypothetical protein